MGVRGERAGTITQLLMCEYVITHGFTWPAIGYGDDSHFIMGQKYGGKTAV